MKILQVVLVTFLWASVLLISEEVSLPSTVFVFYRTLFSLLIIVPIAFIKGELEKPRISHIISGVFLALNWLFLFMAVPLVGPSTADFIYYTAPIISLILSKILGEEIPISSWIAATISFTGVGMIFSFSMSNPIGMLYAFLGALFYGSFVVMGKMIKSSPTSITLYQMIISTIIMFPFTLRYHDPISAKNFMLLLIAGVLNTGIALVLWWDALKKLGVKTASVLSYMDPMFALILSIFLLGYHPRMWEILGGFLILVGGITVSVKSR